jgi:hypothetical protein
MLTLPLSSLQEGQDGDRRNVRRIADRQAVVKAFLANLDRKIIAAPRALTQFLPATFGYAQSAPALAAVGVRETFSNDVCYQSHTTAVPNIFL